MDRITWTNEKRRLSSLIPWERNPRQIREDQAKRLQDSLEEFGQVEPICVGPDNELYNGHQRLAVWLARYGDIEVDVRVSSRKMSEKEREKLTIFLHKGATGQWDFDTLANEFEVTELLEWGFEAGELGFSLDGADSETDREEAAHKTLAEQFVVPPFSVLDARQGYWQERKKAWYDCGVCGDLGGRENAKTTGSYVGSIPGYYYKKELAEEAVGHKLSNKEFEKDYLFGLLPDGTTIAQTTTGGIISQFDPVLCEVVYRWFCPPGGLIINPTAGESTYGIVAAYLGYRYKGVELRSEQAKSNQMQASKIGVTGAEWICGDGRDVYDLVGEDADFIMCCPPYADLEVYSDDPRDLSNMEYDDFIAVYNEIVSESVRRLKNDRFACFVVADIRDKDGNYRNFVSATIEAFVAAGMKLYNEAIMVTPIGSLAVRTPRQFVGSRKLGKTHQNVLIFVKGDWHKAVKTCGDVEVYIPDEPVG